jgi:low affinity Fe/Cu permease
MVRLPQTDATPARLASGGTAFARPTVVSVKQRRQHRIALGTKLPQHGLSHTFSRFASRIAEWMGAPTAFLAAVALILVWLLTGPVFGFSTEWQLIVNSGTTIATFLMVFLIQNTQNRDARALHLKLDELLRATPKARNEFMDAEEEDLDEIEREKAIVDKDDPAPPREHAHSDKVRDGHRGNGKT